MSPVIGIQPGRSSGVIDTTGPTQAELDQRLKVLEERLLPDTGWVVAELKNGYAQLAGRAPVAWRRQGQTLMFRGEFGGFGASAKIAFLLPKAVCPPFGMFHAMGYYLPGTAAFMFVGTTAETGFVEIYYGGAPNQLAIDGISFPLD